VFQELQIFRQKYLKIKNFSWKNNDQFVIIFKHYKFNGTLGHGAKFRRKKRSISELKMVL